MRREVAAGETLQFSREMVDRLRIKFGHKHDPKYDFKDITTEELEQAREKERLTVYKTVKGSSKFQVFCMPPKPNNECCYASLYLWYVLKRIWFLQLIPRV